MKQFSLEKYLENPSRKIVTRSGNPVRIVCWDLKSSTPIIAAIQWNQEREDCYCYNTIGRCANNVGELDLFFVEKEDELTEFEKELASEDLEEAASKYVREDFHERSRADFKAGAEWQKQQMMKDVVDATIFSELKGSDGSLFQAKSDRFRMSGAKINDRIKVIPIKVEQQ